jgi:hypothetical protein
MKGSEAMTSDPTDKPSAEGSPQHLEQLDAALKHLDTSVQSGSIAASAARGIIYSLVETLGALVGDPDLPEHSRSGYEGLLEAARELRAKLAK